MSTRDSNGSRSPICQSSRLPQFADAEELLKQIRTHRALTPFLTDVEISAVTINQKAVDRALTAFRQGAGPDRILLVISVSDAYQQANTGMTIQEYWKMAEKCIQDAKSSGIRVCGVINGIWGCPKTGRTDMQKAVDFTRRWLEMGVDEIEHADHDGRPHRTGFMPIFCHPGCDAGT